MIPAKNTAAVISPELTGYESQVQALMPGALIDIATFLEAHKPEMVYEIDVLNPALALVEFKQIRDQLEIEYRKAAHLLRELAALHYPAGATPAIERKTRAVQ